jgi:hypothetical protein
MLYIIPHNIVGLSIDKTHPPSLPTSIAQDSFQKHSNTRNIYIQLEPDAIRPVESKIISYANQYDFILTFNENILKQCPNAYKYLFGMTRILPEDVNSINITNKKFIITSITNDKLMTVGHHFRHTIFYNQEKILSIPKCFYRSTDSKNLPEIHNNPRLPAEESRKIELFQESQFSLVIENSRQTHYFTEKLCDCLITKTIPVYYGCPNISEYFDTSGWIILENESMDELIKKLYTLTPEYYMNHIDTVMKNFETVKQYIDIQENINRGLRSIPDY